MTDIDNKEPGFKGPDADKPPWDKKDDANSSSRHETHPGRAKRVSKFAAAAFGIFLAARGGVALVDDVSRVEDSSPQNPPATDTIAATDTTNTISTSEALSYEDQLKADIGRLSEKYNVNIVNNIDVSEGNRLVSGDLEGLDNILKIFPSEHFSNSSPEEKFSIYIGEKPSEDEARNSVIVSPEEIRPPGRHSIENPRGLPQTKIEKDFRPVVRKVAGAVAEMVDRQSGNRLSQQLVEILGGEEFLKNPEDLYPLLFEKDGEEYNPNNSDFLNEDGSLKPPAKLLGVIAGYYLTNDEYENPQQFLFDPEGYYPEDIQFSDFAELEKRSTGREVFNLVGKAVFKDNFYYRNTSYEGMIPKLSDVKINWPTS